MATVPRRFESGISGEDVLNSDGTAIMTSAGAFTLGSTTAPQAAHDFKRVSTGSGAYLVARYTNRNGGNDRAVGIYAADNTAAFPAVGVGGIGPIGTGSGFGFYNRDGVAIVGGYTEAGAWTFGAAATNMHNFTGYALITGAPASGATPLLQAYRTTAVATDRVIQATSNVGGAASTVFRVEADGDTISNTGSYTSDARAKKDIEPIQYGLSEILQLSPKSFRWNYETSEDTKSFCISTAQEVEAIMPEMVRDDGLDDGQGGHFKAIYEKEIMAVMVNAIKQQQALIQSLTSRLEALESK